MQFQLRFSTMNTFGERVYSRFLMPYGTSGRTHSENLKNMNKGKIINIITISISLLCLIAYIIYVNIYYKHFNETKINSVVIKSDDWMKNAMIFDFADGNSVSFHAPWGYKMLIGDSVSKPAGSSIFKVYRKDNNDIYVLYKEYDNNEDN